MKSLDMPQDSLMLFIRHCRDDVLKVIRVPVSSLIYPPQSLPVTLARVARKGSQLLRYPLEKQPPGVLSACCKAFANRKCLSIVSYLYKETKNYVTSPSAWTVTYFQLLLSYVISLLRSNRTWREHEGVVTVG